MIERKVFEQITDFSGETHGSSNYYKDEVFVKGIDDGEFAPLSYLIKKGVVTDIGDLQKIGFILDSYALFPFDEFEIWYSHQFGRKLSRDILKSVKILSLPLNKRIFDAIATVNESYELLRKQQILINGKKLPVQLGEWYAKCIFGLEQRKSTSQRGFDFYLEDKRVEVKVHWSDFSSPKGVKIRKSLVEMSDYCIIVYVARNFMVREMCFLDSDFVIRKFAGKGHTIFLKDPDIGPYFFSSSTKHHDKVINPVALMKFSSPVFAMKLTESFADAT